MEGGNGRRANSAFGLARTNPNPPSICVLQKLREVLDFDSMATTRREGIQVFESQFPIVATNLRALVSSWLPPAREPSPVDDEKPIDGQVSGRHERYHQ